METTQTVVMEEMSMIDIIEGNDDDILDLALGADPNNYDAEQYIDEEAIDECTLYSNQENKIF